MALFSTLKPRDARDLIARAGHKTWGIRIEPPLEGPSHVVDYLSRYVHRIAISNSRIVHYDGHTVVFRYKDRQDGDKTKPVSVSGNKFARLFLQHVLAGVQFAIGDVAGKGVSAALMMAGMLR